MTGKAVRERWTSGCIMEENTAMIGLRIFPGFMKNESQKVYPQGADEDNHGKTFLLPGLLDRRSY